MVNKRLVCFSLCLLLGASCGALASPESDALFQQGLEKLYGMGVPQDEKAAIDLLEKAAGSGSAEAAAVLANCYETGQGTSVSLDKAYKWHLKAAELGNIDSMCFVARCHAKGEAGVSESYENAVKWYTQAASKGSTEAMSKLGGCYLLGKGIEVNEKRGFLLISKSAEKGDPVGLYNIAVCYEQGLGVEKDLKRAADFYRKSAELGCPEAMNNYAVCLSEGKGVAQNEDEAKVWFSRAIESGVSLGQ